MKNFCENDFESKNYKKFHYLSSYYEIKKNNCFDKELTLPKQNKSDSNLNNKSIDFPPNIKNQSQTQKENNINIAESSNIENKINNDEQKIKEHKYELDKQNEEENFLDPERICFENNNLIKKENSGSELSDLTEEYELEEINDLLIARIVNKDKNKLLFKKNKRFKKIIDGCILTKEKNDNNDKRKELYLGQLKTDLSYQWN